MPAAEFDGVRIHYRFDGPPDVPVLVLSNSLGTDLHMWDKVVAAMSARYRILRYDTRGHGQSSVPEPPYTIPQLAGDLVKLLDFLHLERVHLCGLSLGGMTAIWLGIHEPSRFNRLIFANTAAKIGNHAMWNERIAAIRASGMEPLAEVMMQRWFTESFLRLHQEELVSPRSVMEKTNADGYIGCCLALRNEDLRAQVSRIQSPGLVIASEFDIATPVTDGRALHEGLPNSEYTQLDAAHLSVWERPQEFQSAVLNFIEREPEN